MARKKLTRADNVKLSTVRRLLKLLGVSMAELEEIEG